MKKRQIYDVLYSRGLRQGDRITKVLKFVEDFSPMESFLDIGCGDGSLTLLLAQAIKARDVKGVELATEGVHEAEEKGIECYAVDIDCDPLPFKDKAFDFIFCGEVIEHLLDPDHLLEEIYRVLKPAGKAIITTPNLGAWYNRLLLLIGYQPYSVSVSLKHYGAGKLFQRSPIAGGEHIRFFTLRAAKDLIQNHNFKIGKVIGVRGSSALLYIPFPLRFFLPVAEMLEKFFSTIPSLSSNIIVELEKNASSRA